ncbi:uncharacterized protein [Neodiprion pinetum]|uniref:uncharacterized protein isoform X1 n=1 Tax=Neodiprion pinetum TaxID=441929 RepID=UPI001EDD08B5|nr:uncharacterized protein LOC124215213 isoform X1 [Neodiprion pinetum]
MADNEKFELVGRRKRGKRASDVLRDNNTSRNISEYDVDNLSRKLKEAKDELNDSKYKISLFQSLKECTQLLNVDRINEIVCYGLGNFFNLKQSRVPIGFWLDREEPVYNKDDIEFITNALNQSLML